VDAGLPVGSWQAGGARACAHCAKVWDSPSYLSQIFAAQKNSGFPPLLKMLEDWRQGSQVAFSGCGLGDGMCGLNTDTDTDTVAVMRIRAYNVAHGDTEPDDA